MHRAALVKTLFTWRLRPGYQQLQTGFKQDLVPIGAIERQGFGKVRVAFGGGVKCRPILGIGRICLLFQHASGNIPANRNLKPHGLSGSEAGGKQAFDLSFDRDSPASAGAAGRDAPLRR